MMHKKKLYSPESSLAVEKGKGAVDHPLHALVKTLHKLEASLHLCQRKLPPVLNLLNVCQADNKVTEGLAMANWIFKSLLIGQYTYVEY